MKLRINITLPFIFLFYIGTISAAQDATAEIKEGDATSETTTTATSEETSSESTEEKPHPRDVNYSEDEILAAESLCKDYQQLEKLLTDKYSQLNLQYTPEPIENKKATCHLWATGAFNNEDIKKEFQALNGILASEWAAKESHEKAWLQIGEYEKENQKLRAVMIVYPAKDSCPKFDEGADEASWQECFQKLPAEKKVLGISLRIEYDAPVEDKINMDELKSPGETKSEAENKKDKETSKEETEEVENKQGS